MSRKRNIENSLIPKGRTLYFNEEAHKYTDDLNNEYISVTTLIGKYTNEFEKEKVAEACEKIGKNPKHPKYLKYKGKTKKEILWEWEQETIKACNKGSIKHNYLEDCIYIITEYYDARFRKSIAATSFVVFHDFASYR